MKIRSLLRTLAGLALPCALALGAGGCAKSGGDTVRIGLVAELTGEISAVGASCRNAAQMAVDRINAAGGLPLVLIRFIRGIRDQKTTVSTKPIGGREMIFFAFIVVGSWIVGLAVILLSMRRLTQKLRSMDQLHKEKTRVSLFDRYSNEEIIRNRDVYERLDDEDLKARWHDLTKFNMALAIGSKYFFIITIVILISILIKGILHFL